MVNIQADPYFAREIVEQRLIPGQFHVLDFMGAFPMDRAEVHHAREMDPGNAMEFAGIKNFIAAIGKLSMEEVEPGTSIRDIAVNGLPIFWVTPLAEKHPGHHWGATLFFFLEFLKRKVSFFDEYEHVKIISPIEPEAMLDAVHTIRPSLKIHPKEVFATHAAASESSLAKFNRFLKNYSHCRKAGRSLQPGNKQSENLQPGSKQPENLQPGNKQPENLQPGNKQAENLQPKEIRTVLINHTESNLVEFANQKFVYGFLKQQSPVLYLNFHLLFTQRHKEPISTLPLQYLPSMGDVIKLGRVLFGKHAQISNLVNRKLKQDQWLVKQALKEMQAVTRQFPLFFYHLWMQKFFSSLPAGAKIFYDNECYTPGRIIAHALKNSDTKKEAIAYQHGYISLNHTVYRFDRQEFMESSTGAKDSLPFPDKILVWGEYFKKQLAGLNPIDPTKIMVAGSPRHQYFRNKYPDGISIASDHAPRKFLWCASSAAFAASEWDIFYPALKNIAGASLEIRMHPCHDLREALSKIVEGSSLPINFHSTENLEDQLPGKDVLICHAQSSVFLDALNVGMPVIRIFTPLMSREGQDPDIANLFNISGVEECREVISRLSIPVTVSSHRAALSDLLGPSDPVVWELTLRN